MQEPITLTLTPLQARYLIAMMGGGGMDLVKAGGEFSGADALVLLETLKSITKEPQP